MANPLEGIPNLELIALGAIQSAADATLGPNVLKVQSAPSGIGLDLTLQDGHVIRFEDIGIGAAGVSAHAMIDGLGPTTPLSLNMAEGFTLGLTNFGFTLANGGLSDTHVTGQLQIPFFKDAGGNQKAVDVEITLRGGELAITLAASQSANPVTADGLVRLAYALGSSGAGLVLELASLELDHMPDGTARIVISGRLELTVGDLQWPGFDLRGLGIDNKGHITLDGGWINLPSQTALDFFGFPIALHKLGLGSDSTGRWLALNGDIHLVEGLPLGGSVRGLRINLDSGALSFDGVSIDLEVADVMTIKGEIDHIHVDASTPADLKNAGLIESLFYQIQNPHGQPALPKHVDVFAGNVAVTINAGVNPLELDGHFIVGHFGGTSVFFLALDAELPVGIPLFLDISLYGLQGLIASNLEPRPEPAHTWWEWYAYPSVGGTIRTDLQPDHDATNVAKWMQVSPGALALGAGAVIGTSVDDGFTACAAISLVLMLPGPVITLIGKANILSKRIGGANQDAMFNAMATFDGNSGTFDLAMDAHYGIPVVLDVEGTCEVRVSTRTSPTWYLALGLPPHERRVKARVFDLFESDAYLVVSDLGLNTGTWTGYRGAWDFGPLSVKLDAYLATLAAIQWSPLQIAGGIELHGQVQLEAFDIGIGITADALLEGCAPDPFWVHGELSVELDLPWPLPDVGASVSLTWGGDDGHVPPAVLALSHVDAILRDHKDRRGAPSGDHYRLLSHLPNETTPDTTVRYDDATSRPGILALNSSNDSAWKNRVKPGDLQLILPDLQPSPPAPPGAYTTLIPQDAHFTLTFAHPVNDEAGFANSKPAPAEISQVQPPSFIAQDDMSNLNPAAPAVQWQQKHYLVEVALFEYDGSTWNLVCAQPDRRAPGSFPKLNGTWVLLPGADGERQVQTQLMVFPTCLLPGEPRLASWGEGVQRTLGRIFRSEALEFELDPNCSPATEGEVLYRINKPGLAVTVPMNSNDSGRVLIQFPASVQITSIVALLFVPAGQELSRWDAPAWRGDGVPINFTDQSQDRATQEWQQSSPAGAPVIRQLDTEVGAGETLVIYEIEYRLPDVPMAILPKAPSLYALQTVTRLEAGRLNNGSASMNSVQDGNPIVEFAYFQTIAGPGTAYLRIPPPSLKQPAPSSLPLYDLPLPPQDLKAFPLGGALQDLATYAQWSWPPDAAASAYYGYDLNVEFVESYVNKLYEHFGNDLPANALHFRCRDRNGNFSLLQPLSIHSPAVYALSALVAKPLTPALPAAIDAARFVQTPGVGQAAIGVLGQRAAKAVELPAALASSAALGSQKALLDLLVSLSSPSGSSAARHLDSATASDVLSFLREADGAKTARDRWFRPLSPRTRYTLEVVAGPFARSIENGTGSLSAMFRAGDASGVLQALNDYQAYEEMLTPLLVVNFTSSRYATFAQQMANLGTQIQGQGVAGVTPIRHYRASLDPVAWLADPAHQDVSRNSAGGLIDQYQIAQGALAAVVNGFDPTADILTKDGSHTTTGVWALQDARQKTELAWQNLNTATNAIFDNLLSALAPNNPFMKCNCGKLPDSELSVFLNSTGKRVLALLIESPEPIEWRRVWKWVRLAATPDAQSVVGFQSIFWSKDGTRALLVIQGKPIGAHRLSISFQGNLGAEIPCITVDGEDLEDFVDLGQISLGTTRVPPIHVKAKAPRKSSTA